MEWEMRPLDTLFFRGPSPFTAGESVYLESLFPPTPHTVQGMVRTALLEGHGIDPEPYGKGQFDAKACPQCGIGVECVVPPVVGVPGKSGGLLELRGPYLVQGGERLYPAPADLRKQAGEVVRISPGAPVRCHAGVVRLPDGPADVAGKWITEGGLTAYLGGGVPHATQLCFDEELFRLEPRVGLGLDRGTGAASQGMLYSIAPLRLCEGVGFGVRVSGADDALLRQGLGVRRLGGEGRLVEVTQLGGADALPSPDLLEQTVQGSGCFRLVLLQPADFQGSWLPQGFKDTEVNEAACWRGELRGIAVQVVVSCGDAPVVIGGWDMANQRPRPLGWCVPAGTVYYCKLEHAGDAGAVVSRLHDGKIGENTEMGFGHAAVGVWTEA